MKRGRPIKSDSKKNQYRIRMTDGEVEMLNYLSGQYGKPKSEIIRKALSIYFKLTRSAPDLLDIH